MDWDSSLETGHELVDEQHRELISIFNEIARTPSAGGEDPTVGDLLVRLSDYVSTHFSAEEGLMEDFAYSDAEVRAHREQHEELSSRTRELVLAHRRGETANVLPLAALLQEWLTVHIQGADREFVAHIRESRSDRAC